jgi:hypothetical protein
VTGDGDRSVLVTSCRARLWEGPKLGLAAGFEGLDNDHAPAAARTSVPRLVFVSTRGVIALAARRGWVGCAEEPAGQCDIGGSAGIGEEAIMADAVNALGRTWIRKRRTNSSASSVISL